MFKKFLPLLGFIALAQLAGLIGSYFTLPAIDSWYAGLAKPPFSPPNWIFGPVWTILYTLIGIAAFLVYKKLQRAQQKKKQAVRSALSIFGVQLVLNSLWSVIFFGLKSPAWAFIELILLWVAIGVMIQRFARVSFAAAFLVLPYFLWVTFALMLNLAIVLLN